MGAFQSHEMIDSQDCESTPPREPGIPKRLLPFDPRSPTDDIARTPIIVDNTPSELLTLDPRSPTYGIERTPLTAFLNKDFSAGCDMEIEVEVPPQFVTAADTAPLCQPDDADEADMATPHKPTSDPLCQEKEDFIPDLNADDVSPLMDNIEQQPVRVPDPTPMQTKVVSYPKKLFAATHKDPGPLKQSVAPRSPLGLVARDTNSPRNIVQTKQRRQVLRSLGGVGGDVGVDKENLAH